MFMSFQGFARESIAYWQKRLSASPWRRARGDAPEADL